MSKEALRTQLDALRVDNQRLLAENIRLKEDHPAVAAGIEAEAEITKLKYQIEQLQEENAGLNSTVGVAEARLQELMETAETQWESQLKDDLEQSQSERDEMQRRKQKLEDDMQALEKDMELHTLRAVNKERQRWEDQNNYCATYRLRSKTPIARNCRGDCKCARTNTG